MRKIYANITVTAQIIIEVDEGATEDKMEEIIANNTSFYDIENVFVIDTQNIKAKLDITDSK